MGKKKPIKIGEYEKEHRIFYLNGFGADLKEMGERLKKSDLELFCEGYLIVSDTKWDGLYEIRPFPPLKIDPIIYPGKDLETVSLIGNVRAVTIGSLQDHYKVYQHCDKRGYKLVRRIQRTMDDMDSALEKYGEVRRLEERFAIFNSHTVSKEELDAFEKEKPEILKKIRHLRMKFSPGLKEVQKRLNDFEKRLFK